MTHADECDEPSRNPQWRLLDCPATELDFNSDPVQPLGDGLVVDSLFRSDLNDRVALSIGCFPSVCVFRSIVLVRSPLSCVLGVVPITRGTMVLFEVRGHFQTFMLAAS